jgi:uncharacterized RDD family membrane protein YckC
VTCPRCGRLNPDDAEYCKTCGAKLRTRRVPGFDRLQYDVDAQTLWITRLIAYIIDTVIVSVVMLILSILVYVPLLIGSIVTGIWGLGGILQIPFFIGLGLVTYFTIMEGMYGATFGKQIMGLHVENIRGGTPGFGNALIRNLSKIHFLILLTDIIVGIYFLEDPRDKYSDRLSGTYVVRGRGSIFFPYVGFGSSKTHSRPYRRNNHDYSRRSGGDPLDLMDLGVLLIVLASIAINYPQINVVIVNWFRSWTVSGITPIPRALFVPLYWFFIVMGSWGIFSGLIRYISGWRVWKAPDDVFGGIFSISVAYLVQYYGEGLFGWSVLVAAFFIFLGARIVLSILFSRYFWDS